MKMDKKGGSFVLINKIGSLQTGVRVGSELIKNVLHELLV